MLREVLELAVLIALWNNGLSFLLSENQLLGWLGDWYESRGALLQLVLKPVLGCVYCFSSFWGLFVSYLYYQPQTIEKVAEIAPIVVLACMAAISFTGFLVNRFDRYGM